MQNSYAQQDLSSLVSEQEALGVFFESKAFYLLANYDDEISACRAKRNWLAALEEVLLLTSDSDFKIETRSNRKNGSKTSLFCHFASASARYAFWKLTNNQAAEAQYMIETAHIPNSRNHRDLVITAPDMRQLDEPLVLSGERPRQDTSLNILEWLKSFTKNTSTK